MSWLYLIVAGLCEMAGVGMMGKFGKEQSWHSFLWMAFGFGFSFLFLSLAMKTLPMSTAYAVWTGIGAAGGALLGMVLYGESRHPLRVLCIVFVIGSAVGLKLVG